MAQWLGGGSRIAFAALVLLPLVACSPSEEAVSPATMPDEVPTLRHVGLNSTDADAAIDWYLRLWPTARRGSFDGKQTVEAEMDLVINEVSDPPAGAFDPELGRPAEQSALWHIGAFANTTEGADELAALGLEHLPLYVGLTGSAPVWRSGLAPYNGVRTVDQLASAEPADPRPGGFSYVLGPDGALFELTGGPNTTPALAHVHLFHEQPACAANWYVTHLGMSLPPIRNQDGTTTERPLAEPCEGEIGPAGWPSLEPGGTLRAPRAAVVHGNGSLSFYPRQCHIDRCGSPQPLVPTRGQVLDHVGFEVGDLDGWFAWLEASGVTVIDGIREFDEGRAFVFEGPDRLAIELVELGD